MDPVNKILGFEEHPHGEGKCYSCGNKGQRRFDGGGEGVLCDRCWKEAKEFYS